MLCWARKNSPSHALGTTTTTTTARANAAAAEAAAAGAAGSGRISSKSSNSNSRSSGCRSTSNRNSDSNRNGSTSNKEGDSERGEQRQRASEGLEIISKGTSADCGNCKAQSASTLSIDEGMECRALALFPPYAQASHFKQQNPMCASSCSSGNV